MSQDLNVAHTLVLPPGLVEAYAVADRDLVVDSLVKADAHALTGRRLNQQIAPVSVGCAWRRMIWSVG